jgi:hypothetical protein
MKCPYCKAGIAAMYRYIHLPEKKSKQGPMQQFAFSNEQKIAIQQGVHEHRIQITDVVAHRNKRFFGQFTFVFNDNWTEDQSANQPRPKSFQSKGQMIGFSVEQQYPKEWKEQQQGAPEDCTNPEFVYKINR